MPPPFEFKELAEPIPPIDPRTVRYIKFGEGGRWEDECCKKGIIRIGFGSGRPERFQICHTGRWEELAASYMAEGKDKGTANRFTKELRLLFEDDGTRLWITFMHGRLYWGMADSAPPEMHPDGDGVYRQVRGGWRDTDIEGKPLSKDRLSGALTKLAAYRGTSCDVDVSQYVIRRINAQKMPEVERALAASEELRSAIVGLMRMLVPRDFELLVDLVFSTSGWRRIGAVGRTQETVDIELVLPSTSERAFVQVKSRTTTIQLKEYIAKLDARADLYGRMFFVYHSGEPVTSANPCVTLIGPERLAEMVLYSGLTGWLIEKVS